MNFLKRALLSLWGHKGRSILLILVFSVIATLIFSSMVIHSAAQQEIKATKQMLCANVTLREKMKDGVAPNIPFSITNKFIKNKYVSDYNYETGEEIIYKGIEVIGQNGAVIGMNGMLLGVRESRISTTFTAGGYKIIEGRPITVQDENKPNIIIEKRLAQKNNLKLGDKISVSTAYAEVRDHKPEIIEKFNIVGIFEAPKVDSIYTTAALFNPSDFAFCSYTEVDKHDRYILPDSYTGGTLRITYYLDDPADVEPFKAEISKQLDMNKYELLTDKNWYSRVAGPLESTVKVTNLMDLLVILAGAAIFVLIVFLFQRGRKREYGILLSIGEKKSRIVGQCFAEILLPLIIALVVASGASGAIGQATGNWLLSLSVKPAQNQIAKQVNAELKASGQENGRNPHSELVGRDDTLIQPASSLDISLKPADYAEFAGVMLITLLISVGASSFLILRLDPAKVLSRRE